MGRPKGSKNKTTTTGEELAKVIPAEGPVITKGWCERCQRGHKFYDGKCLER